VIPSSGGIDNAPLFDPGANGMEITFNGMTLNVVGQPNAGDSFQTAPSQKTDIFNSLQNLITSLQSPTDGNPAQLAQLQQVMSQASAIFATGYSQVVSYQSEIGTRAATVTSQTQLNDSLSTSEEGIMIKLAVADPFEVLSSITQQETYLKASLGAYKEMQDVLMSILQMK
jgi:flagellar hook-associated protein 3 FlgL